VCTLAAVASMLSGVLVGLLALGEEMPRGAARRLLRLASWVLILGGVANLAGGDDAGGGLAAWAADVVRGAPLPRGLRVWLLSALRALAGGGDAKGRGPRPASLLSAGSGHDEGGPALPLVASALAPDGGGPVRPASLTQLQRAE
jgi:hypothetical protein